jgi:hypothetical protein
MPPAAWACQFRFTRIMPVPEPPLVSETAGAFFVRVTLLRLTGAGVPCCGVGCCGFLV